LSTALSRTTGELIAGRAAMGAAAALIYPATLAPLTSTFTEARERATAIGVWSAVSGLAVTIGPVSGGLLLRHFSWSSVFWVNVPVVVIALAAGARLLPESWDSHAGRFDPLGGLLSVAGTGLLVWTVIEAPGHGWASPATLAGFAGTAAILAGFAFWQIRRPDPMLDVRVFATARFSAASGAIALASSACSGSSSSSPSTSRWCAGTTRCGPAWPPSRSPWSRARCHPPRSRP
jgi:DHA2 family multidrug resistance protein-like MFS transporter